MIRFAIEVGHNVYNVLSVSVGAISGVVIAVLNSQSRHRKTIESLHKKLEEQRSELAGLKKAFSIVYDAYDRDFKDDPDRIDMLKDLKKEYNL
tara:strand:- start:902 stop:1180 length:279 start_codon:yes stop_codon:yes gene_type:complete